MKAAWVVPLLLVACAAGCDRDPETTYGTVRGESLNGVSAFVQLLRDSGRRTTTRRWLGERMIGRHDVAIVIADDSPAPLEEPRGLLERFLAAPGGQTVVFVIRNSDAAIDYWRTVADFPGLAKDKAATARRNLADADHLLRKQVGPPFAAGTEPLAYGLAARTEPRTLPVEVRPTGTATEPVSARWPRRHRLDPPPGGTSLWSGNGEPLLVERQTASGDRTLLLASAAPLLNGGLVDPGNRRLAGDLVALLPADCRVVVVGSAQVRPDREERDLQPSMWRLVTVQPNPWIALQTLLAIGLFCWWKSPVFGRPRRETAGRPQDFSHHVTALAALLRRSRDEAFVDRRLDAWRRPGETPDAARRSPADGA